MSKLRIKFGVLFLTMGLLAMPAMGDHPACNEDAGNCCIFTGNSTPGCDNPFCCHVVCNFDPFCCDVEWDDLCVGFAFEICIYACIVDFFCCPDDSISDGEVCGDDLNGGCNSVPAVYTAASIGNTYCGIVWSDGTARDTDWYLVSVPEGGRLTSTLRSEFNGVTFIVDISNCNPVVIGQSGSSINCIALTVASADNLAAGDYVVFVAPDLGELLPCSPSGNSYSIVISDDPPPPSDGVQCVNSGDTQLTHNQSLFVFTSTGIACGVVGGITTENFYARSYTMESDLAISCVRWGIESNSGLADHPGFINIYLDTNGGTPDAPIGDLQLLGSSPITITANSPLTLVPGDFDPPIIASAGQQIVVELNVLDGMTSTPTTGIFPGANNYGESADSYIKAADCGIDGYVSLTSMGFPFVHLVNTINGTACGNKPCTGDLDCNGTVNTIDLLTLFAAWGLDPGNPADLDGNGTVNTNDLLILFANWGPCS